MVFLGVDLGGTKIEVAALDETSRFLTRMRVATPQGDYGATLGAIAALVRRVDEELGERGSLGIGTPGALSGSKGVLKNSNSLCLIGKPILDDLQRLLERPIRMANDANCFALSEARDGAAKGAEVVFGVILGTGVGGGIVVRGRILEGRNAIAGEWGHNPLPWPLRDEAPGPECYCGKRGWIETFISGPGLARDLRARGGDDLPADAVVERANAGDRACIAAMERYEDRLARALASVINILDPDVIVLGGGLSNVERLYETVPRLWTRYVFSDTVETPLVRAVHGDSSGVRGAAFLWDASA